MNHEVEYIYKGMELMRQCTVATLTVRELHSHFHNVALATSTRSISKVKFGPEEKIAF